jgi:hypothetical protein
VGQAGRPVTLDAHLVPTRWRIGADRPDRILLFVVDNYVIATLILGFFHGHTPQMGGSAVWDGDW